MTFLYVLKKLLGEHMNRFQKFPLANHNVSNITYSFNANKIPHILRIDKGLYWFHLLCTA